MPARDLNTDTGKLINRLVLGSVVMYGFDSPRVARTVLACCPARLQRDPSMPLAIRLAISAARVRRMGRQHRSNGRSFVRRRSA